MNTQATLMDVKPTADPVSGPARRSFRARNKRRVLLVSPPYTRSFGTFHHAFPLMGVGAFMPPQGILVLAGYLPEEWEIRFVDENLRPARDSDYRWADVVMMSGMHVQRDQILAIAAKAQALGKVAVLGGPSVSGCPEWYGSVDLIHVGEMGDATIALLRRLDESVARPRAQEVYTTEERLPLTEFPLPAYHLIRLTDYFLGSIQFSSGCPYRCEFCDIPELYGRNPRLKSPEQVTGELDAMLERGNPGAVYFVDDNFIGNKKAAVTLLRELVRWQEAHGFPLEFACEATLNLAQADDVLELMRKANFNTVFCGIETPEEHALEFMHKNQNLREPILDAVHTLNSYGLEVVSGIIIGLDTDTPSTGERIVDFVKASGIPLLTINILHALPRTPLWRRLEAAGRLVDPRGRESNVDFLLPYETVVEMWGRCVAETYTPEAVYERFEYQLDNTYCNRPALPNSRARLSPRNLWRGASILARIVWHVGIRSDYRKRFWQMARPRLRELKIEEVIHVGLVAHHLIQFARDCSRGEAERCFYTEARLDRQPISVR